MKIALVGNPNSGKTTIYNTLTGENEKIGNWAGVTVDKNEHKIKSKFLPRGEKVTLVDLPGAHSMDAFTNDEDVTSSYIKKENPDVIINVVDASSLEKSLFFTTQILELGIPTIVCLNKSDILYKNSIYIDIDLLSKKLGCKVIKCVSTSKKDLKHLINIALCEKDTIIDAPYKDDLSNVEDSKKCINCKYKRFNFVKNIVKEVEKRNANFDKITFTDKVDKLITGKFIGILLFALIIYFVFYISQKGPAIYLADFLTALLEDAQLYVGTLLEGSSPVLSSILIDGIIGGVIAVVGFLPLIMIMYFLIALLEDSGYMARVAVVLDPLFKKVGLSGKSVISFVVGTGCSVPGIMASRAIKDEREREATAMLTPFMPCGAKLPVIALFATAFFKDTPWIGASMYLSGIVLIFIGAFLINKIVGVRPKQSYFIIELPDYKIPSFTIAFKSMCSRGKSYIIKAGTIILVCNFIVHILQSFTWDFTYLAYNDIIDNAYLHLENLKNSGNMLTASELENYWANINAQVEALSSRSILASFANPFSYVLIPIIGASIWQLSASVITGFIAKENVVGTIAVCFAIPNLISTGDLELIGDATLVSHTLGISAPAALAFLVFNLFSPPCFAAIGAMNSELSSKKWLLGAIGLELFIAYVSGFLIYQLGTLFTLGTLGNGFIMGLISVLIMIGFVCYLILKPKETIKKDCKVSL